MDTNNILSPKALLSLPPFIVYGLVNKEDKKFLLFGTEAFLNHYANTLRDLKLHDVIKRDIMLGKVECVILETINDTSNYHYKNNSLLLVGKHYDKLIEEGYSPYRNHRFMRVKIVSRKQQDGRVNLYAQTTRGDNIFLAQFNNISDCDAYQKRWYSSEKVYRLYQYKKE